MNALIAKLKRGVDLTSSDVNEAMSLLLSDSTDDTMKAEFLVALHRKGESVEEIVAFVQQLVDRAIDPLIDPKNL
jgi:anthranilate phosphoribosyltransferase